MNTNVLPIYKPNDFVRWEMKCLDDEKATKAWTSMMLRRRVPDEHSVLVRAFGQRSHTNRDSDGRIVSCYVGTTKVGGFALWYAKDRGHTLEIPSDTTKEDAIIIVCDVAERIMKERKNER